MKLILTQEVAGLGAAGDVVEVKDGYGRNYLDPPRFRHPLDAGGEKTVESIKKARSARAVRDADHAAEVKARLEGSTFNVPVRAGEGGRLFGAVTAADIAAAITDGGAEVDKRTIVRRQPDQVARRPHRDRQGPRRRRGEGQPERRLRLTLAAAVTRATG